MHKMKLYAPTVLRIGIALVFIWFGTQEVTNPNSWTIFIPAFLTNLSGLTALTVVKLNGWFEIIAGFLLLVGYQTRIVALLLALHIADIAYIVGYNPIGIRDFGLTVASLSIFMQGMSPFSLDELMSEKSS